ncbi:unnamed protein product [Lepeophtheirus salmonis]|uniref:(salmon louse) hypothetical protein n=1 Tax=Lepeophtheirus salmonis TaxID=72036 RepID=A0A7R8CXM0_LEPSM|nr:unnamed protein product [Lepeophtheirus salmonis]CAF2932358.1 unnamed protein product [Lepeophtheirus salmonis]
MENIQISLPDSFCWSAGGQRCPSRSSQLSKLQTSITALAVKNPASVPTSSSSQSEMDFFDLEAEREETYSTEKGVMDYLRSTYNLQNLHQFCNIKKVFWKDNTPTPSSPPPRRLSAHS